MKNTPTTATNQSTSEYAIEVMTRLESNPVFHRNSSTTIGHYSPEHRAIIVVKDGETDITETDNPMSVANMADSVAARANAEPDQPITIRRISLNTEAAAIIMAIAIIPAIGIGAWFAVMFRETNPPITQWATISGIAGMGLGTTLIIHHTNQLIIKTRRIAKILSEHRSTNRPTTDTEYISPERRVRIIPTR